MTVVTTAMLGVTGLLGLAMVANGVIKFRGGHVEDFERYGYPQWFHLTTGVLEFLAGVALFAGLVVGNTVALAGGLVAAAVLVGAILTHVRVGDSAPEMVPAAILLVLALAVVAHRTGLIG